MGGGGGLVARITRFYPGILFSAEGSYEVEQILACTLRQDGVP